MVRNLIVVLNHCIKASKVNFLTEVRKNVYIIKLLKNIEKKCINNVSHKVKKFYLLKRPMGAYDAYSLWALRVGPVYGPYG